MTGTQTFKRSLGHAATLGEFIDMEQARINHDLMHLLDPRTVARRVGKLAEEIRKECKLLLVRVLARAHYLAQRCKTREMRTRFAIDKRIGVIGGVRAHEARPTLR